MVVEGLGNQRAGSKVSQRFFAEEEKFVVVVVLDNLQVKYPEIMKKKIAVVLSGCGVYDGAEIHESVLTLLSIDRNGAEYHCFAPDMNQFHVINHLTGKEMAETRNVLVEAARIARGKIIPLSHFNASDYDALIFPGGFGAAKNLCSYAMDGVDFKVNRETEHAVKEMVKAGKPIGALCISPVIMTKILGDAEVTIGNDQNTAGDITKMGGSHHEKNHGEVYVDSKYKLVTTPCYMLNASVARIAEGIDKLVITILSMI